MRDEGANRLAVRRRRLDHREIADAEHRHVQRARNRRRGHRQHLAPACGSCLMRSLSTTPKRCSSSITSSPSFGNSTSLAAGDACRRRCRPCPAPYVVDDLLVLLVAAEARDHLDAHRIVLEAVAKVCSNAARRGSSSAPAPRPAARPSPHEGRAQRDLGLAEAGVAANQPIHRLGSREIADDVVDRGLLVGGLLELEALAEFLVIAPGCGNAWPSTTSRAA